MSDLLIIYNRMRSSILNTINDFNISKKDNKDILDRLNKKLEDIDYQISKIKLFYI